jgi:hypothetical protein
MPPIFTPSTVIPNGTYRIANVHTGAYAGLLNDDDQTDLLNLGLGGQIGSDRGLTVRLISF